MPRHTLKLASQIRLGQLVGVTKLLGSYNDNECYQVDKPHRPLDLHIF